MRVFLLQKSTIVTSTFVRTEGNVTTRSLDTNVTVPKALEEKIAMVM